MTLSTIHFCRSNSINCTILHIQILRLQSANSSSDNYSLPFFLGTLSFKTPIQFILIGMTSTKTSKPLRSRIMNTFRCKRIPVRWFKKTHLSTNWEIVEITECLGGMLHYCHCEFYGCVFSGLTEDSGSQSDEKKDPVELHCVRLEVCTWEIVGLDVEVVELS